MSKTPSAEVFWFEPAKLWWPVADPEPQRMLDYVIKRVTDSDLTVKACKRRRTCVQAGGFIGFWPIRLARSFERVFTFEIMPGCYEALRRNCAGLSNVTVAELGLGTTDGEEVPVLPSFRPGQWRVDPTGTETATLITIDSLGLNDCDAIVLDIEGYEVGALMGAAETIARCRPVIHVEELPRSKAEIQAHLKALGYREHARVHGDAIYVPA